MIESPQHTWQVRQMVRDDLELVRAWRNATAVREFMFTEHEIESDEHSKWFDMCSSNPLRHLLIVLQESIPCGFASLDASIGGAVAEWGFYKAPGAPRGTGFLVGTAVLKHAFEVIGIQKVFGQVILKNSSSIGLHERLGFQKEGILREQRLIGIDYHDVVFFGLLRREWQRDVSGA